MKKKFAVIGSSGYIAPRHLKAINETGNEVVSATDLTPNNNLKDIFPTAKFFDEFSDFDKDVQDLADKNDVDFVVICSPNYLHFEHIKWALEKNISVICEKPLALSINELDELKLLEENSQASVYSILQLRFHNAIDEMKKSINNFEFHEKVEGELTYITPRDKSYLETWKGNEKYTGGIATNIGIHFFDMLHYLYGNMLSNNVYFRDSFTVSGFTEYENANIRWFLSIKDTFIPKDHNEHSYRVININNEELDFSTGFEDLHTLSYKEILNGNGFGIDQNRTAIDIVEKIRSQNISNYDSNTHKFLNNL